jgi:soluble lytic murein transglycosylase-like protein
MTLYREEIELAASEHGLNADLVEAVVLTESSGRADAFRYEPDFYRRYLQGKPEWVGKNPRRVASSYGLMQVMFTTAQQYGFNFEPELLFLPYRNLDYGCRHLAALLQWSRGNVRQALAAYNGGKGNWKAQQPQDYAAKVLAARDALLKAQA